jgi:hypothetical protein
MNQQEPVSTTETHSSVKLFSPTLIAGLTIITSFPSGYILSLINWHRMGYEKKKRQHIFWLIISTMLVTYLFVFTDISRLLPFILNIAFAIQFLKEMTWEQINYERDGNTITNEKWYKGLFIALAVLLVLIVLVAILMLGISIFSFPI